MLFYSVAELEKRGDEHGAEQRGPEPPAGLEHGPRPSGRHCGCHAWIRGAPFQAAGHQGGRGTPFLRSPAVYSQDTGHQAGSSSSTSSLPAVHPADVQQEVSGQLSYSISFNLTYISIQITYFPVSSIVRVDIANVEITELKFNFQNS